MDTTKKNNDCYFYYYSTCTKGDSCLFRHEEGALGCEVVCSYWKEGKCFNQHCNYRHMELKKNRKSIPCYWETQPSGCCKPHCPFFHRNSKSGTENLNEGKNEIKQEPTCLSATKRSSQGSESSYGNASVVDPVVVSFEEESDNESVPSTPLKIKTSHVSIKTLEQIKLDKIQAESAAYYSFPEELIKDIRKEDLSFQIMSIDEIRKKKKVDEGVMQSQPDSTTMKKEDVEEDMTTTIVEEHRSKRPIRLKRGNVEENPSRVKIKRSRISDNSSVSSTNVDSVCDEPLSEQVPCSSGIEEDVSTKVTEDDLLKDIDELLGD